LGSSDPEESKDAWTLLWNGRLAKKDVDSRRELELAGGRSGYCEPYCDVVNDGDAGGKTEVEVIDSLFASSSPEGCLFCFDMDCFFCLGDIAGI